jgi:hypothetical protein
MSEKKKTETSVRKKINRLRELRKEHEDSTEFAREACDEELCCSMAEGRRLFNNL